MKMKKRNILLLIFLFFFAISSSIAQNSWQWAARAGGVGTANVSPDGAIKDMVTETYILTLHE